MKRSTQLTWPDSLLILGIALSLTGAGGYYFAPYRTSHLLLWLGSIGVTLVYFFRRKSENSANAGSPWQGGWGTWDTRTLFALALILAPLYLVSVYDYPVEVDNDEIITMTVEKTTIAERPLNLAGLRGGYFYFPTFAFAVRGWLGERMGGITLRNMRRLSGLIGVANLILAFFFFRLSLPTVSAAAAVVLLGSNHALIGLNRMAIRENTALFVQLAALMVLLHAFRRRSYFYGFLGGVLAGFALHVNFPGRLTVLIWFLFAGFALIMRRWETPWKTALTLIAVNILGVWIAAAPVVATTLRHLPDSTEYARSRLLWTTTGGQIAQEWAGAATPAGGRLTNIKKGLTTFNAQIPDHANIYKNYATPSGFVDPLTGALVWTGVALVCFMRRGRKRRDIDLLAVTGFILSWLVMTFVTNKAPAYTSLILTLPFVAYLVVMSLETLQRAAPSAAGEFVMPAALAIIAGWNLLWFSNVMRNGAEVGHDIGGTARFLESRLATHAEYSFYIVNDPLRPYLRWGDPEYCLRFFVPPSITATVIKDDQMFQPKRRPFVVLMPGSAWRDTTNAWNQRYPDLFVQRIKPDGSLIAVEAR